MAKVEGELLYLFARLRIDHDLSERYPAIVACVGALEEGVMGLYSVVVGAGLRYSVGVHKSSLWAGLRGVTSTCGAIPLSDILIIPILSPLSTYLGTN